MDNARVEHLCGLHHHFLQTYIALPISMLGYDSQSKWVVYVIPHKMM